MNKETQTWLLAQEEADNDPNCHYCGGTQDNHKPDCYVFEVEPGDTIHARTEAARELNSLTKG